MNTMNFREAVKRVHPDINPNIVDAGDKMRVLTTHKNEPREIYMWMRKWGLVGVANNKQEPQYEWLKVTALVVNSIYNGIAVVRHKNGNFYRVYRTTNKRAYFMGNSDGRKFCHVNSITDAWIKQGG